MTRTLNPLIVVKSYLFLYDLLNMYFLSYSFNHVVSLSIVEGNGKGRIFPVTRLDIVLYAMCM